MEREHKQAPKHDILETREEQTQSTKEEHQEQHNATKSAQITTTTHTNPAIQSNKDAKENRKDNTKKTRRTTTSKSKGNHMARMINVAWKSIRRTTKEGKKAEDRRKGGAEQEATNVTSDNKKKAERNSQYRRPSPLRPYRETISGREQELGLSLQQFGLHAPPQSVGIWVLLLTCATHSAKFISAHGSCELQAGASSPQVTHVQHPTGVALWQQPCGTCCMEWHAVVVLGAHASPRAAENRLRAPARTGHRLSEIREFREVQGDWQGQPGPARAPRMQPAAKPAVTGRAVTGPGAHSHIHGTAHLVLLARRRAVAAGKLPPVVVLSRRQLSTSPPSPKMYWNARLNAAGKQCGYWNSDPLRLPRPRPAGG
jgi:hypothetical protein